MARFKPLRSGVDSNCVLGGDLNPLLGFYFPLFSTVFPWRISIRVAICGKEWNQNCSFFVVDLPTNFPCVLIIVRLFAGT
jgi:hypothetical protein